MLKHETGRGLEKISALRRFQADGTMRPFPSSAAMAASPRFRNGARRRRRHDRYAFPDMLVEWSRLSRARSANGRTTSSTPAPLIRYEQQQGSAGGAKYVLQRARRHRFGCADASRDGTLAQARAEWTTCCSLARHEGRAISGRSPQRNDVRSSGPG
jgi:4-hydroxy-tetrahydrodipicolinate synthase